MTHLGQNEVCVGGVGLQEGDLLQLRKQALTLTHKGVANLQREQ